MTAFVVGVIFTRRPHLEREAPTPDGSLSSRIEAALRAHRGNVTAAARALGMHRTQLRRWLEKEGVDPRAFA